MARTDDGYDRACRDLARVQQRAHEMLGLPRELRCPTELPRVREHFRNVYRNRHDGSVEGFAAFMAGYEADWRAARTRCPTPFEDPNWFMLLERLVADIERALEREGRRLGRRVVFGSLPSGDVNAFAMATSGTDTRVVVLSRGLFGYINLMAKAVASTWTITAKEGDTVHYSATAESIEARVADTPALVSRFADVLIAYVTKGDPHVAEPYVPGGAYEPLVAGWREAAERFVVGHEYGHLLAGHLDDAGVRQHRIAAALGADEIATSFAEEYEADAIGFRLARAAAEAQGADVLEALAGAELFFKCDELAERAIAVLENGKVGAVTSDSHPPPIDRRHALRAALVDANDPRAREAIAEAAGVCVALDVLWRSAASSFERMHRNGVRPLYLAD